jgi:hypothetical protein
VAKVYDLQPGDLVRVPGIEVQGVFITRAEHPTYLGLELVIWKMSNGKMSFDALYANQDIGEIMPSTGKERGERLMRCLE